MNPLNRVLTSATRVSSTSTLPTVRTSRTSGPSTTSPMRTPMFWTITGSIVNSPANLAVSSGTRSIPQIGQPPSGDGSTTHGCMPHVHQPSSSAVLVIVAAEQGGCAGADRTAEHDAEDQHGRPRRRGRSAASTRRRSGGAVKRVVVGMLAWSHSWVVSFPRARFRSAAARPRALVARFWASSKSSSRRQAST